MKKTVARKVLSFLLVINLACLLLTGCGAGNPANSSVGGGNGQDIAADDSAGGSNSGENEQNGIGNPAYYPNGRQVLTAAVAFPWITNDVQERIRAFNENSQSYFVETKRYVDEAWDDVAGACSFSICKNSGNQEGAWEFIKSCFTIDAQREVEVNPLLRSVFEEKIQEALTVEYETVDGIEQEKIRYEVLGTEVDGIIGVSYITEEDAEIYRSIIENTHRSAGSDFGIMDIIMEEAGAYFENDKDASTVADIIQNRVRIYVSERM